MTECTHPEVEHRPRAIVWDLREGEILPRSTTVHWFCCTWCHVKTAVVDTHPATVA